MLRSLRVPLTAIVAALAFSACTPATHSSSGPAPRTTKGHARALGVVTRSGLMIPVPGILPEQLRDSYDSPRSGGRTHAALDIHAARGTPVLAAADGRILKLRQGSRGGIALYQLDRDGRTCYYYAHMLRYAAGIREGHPVRQGEVIGYVGDTGNAARGDYHLHFSVSILSDPGRWWEGVNLNPYLLLGTASRGL